MPKLKSIEIRKFGRVRPTSLAFAEGKNVILGKNATGKTTLLELVAAVAGAKDDARVLNRVLDVTTTVLSRSGAASAEMKWSFSRVVRVQETESAVADSAEPTSRLEPSRAQFDETIDATMTADDGSTGTFRSKNGQGDLYVEGTLIPMMRWPHGAGLWALRNLPPMLHRAMKKASSPRNHLFHVVQRIDRFDEGVELFGSILSTMFLVTQSDKIPMVLSGRDEDQAIRSVVDSPFTSIGAFGAIPDALLATRAEQGAVKADVTASLAWVAAFLDVLSIEAHLPPPTTRGNFWQYTGLTFRFKRPHALLSPELLSFGQKRLFTFGCVLATHPSIVVADELVNGMHYDWIKECLARLDERQAFLTSQNPLLVDLLEFTSVEEVRKTFIICSAEPGTSGEEELVWRNMTTDEATRFFEAYQGVRYVSEILMDMGLW